MNSETMSRIFDPFFSTKFTGRGLGLPAVLGIVRGHHGAIKIHSEIGKGTYFRVLFPVSPRPPQPIRSPSQPPPEWRGQGTGAAGDDEPGIRMVAQEMLQRLGFTVLTAVDGHEAIEVFRREKERIRLVILT